MKAKKRAALIAWIREGVHSMLGDAGDPDVGLVIRGLTKVARALEKTEDMGPELVENPGGILLTRKEVLRCLRAAGHTIPKDTILEVVPTVDMTRNSPAEVHPSRRLGLGAPRLVLRLPS